MHSNGCEYGVVMIIKMVCVVEILICAIGLVVSAIAILTS